MREFMREREAASTNEWMKGRKKRGKSEERWAQAMQEASTTNNSLHNATRTMTPGRCSTIFVETAWSARRSLSSSLSPDVISNPRGSVAHYSLVHEQHTTGTGWGRTGGNGCYNFMSLAFINTTTVYLSTHFSKTVFTEVCS